MRAFVAVVNRRSFTRAADDLSVTQAAVSGLIKELEEAAGFQLIERSSPVRVTNAGRDFHAAAQRVLAELEAAEASLELLSRGLRGRVSIAVGHLVALAFLPAALQRFRGRFPNVEVQVVDRAAQGVVRRVQSAEADFGIAMDQPVPADIERRLVLTEEIAVVCANGHPFARARTISWQDVVRELIIVANPRSGMWARIGRNLESIGLTFGRSLEVTHFATALSMAATSGGITLLPRSCQGVAQALGGTMIFVRAPMLTRSLGMYTRRTTSLSPAAAALAEEMIREIQLSATQVPEAT